MKKIVFGILALGLLTGCSINIDMGKDDDKKEENNQQVENNEQNNSNEDVNVNNEISIYDNKEFFDFSKITIDTYAFVVVENDQNGSDLKVLNKNSDSQVIASCTGDCGIWGLQTKDNKFYFYIHHFLNREGGNGPARGGYFKLISINLNDYSAKVEMESSDFSTNYYYDLNDKYVFSPADNYKGILRYDLNTKEVTTINNSVESGELFILDNKIYVKSGLKYYTIDFNGNNLTYISEYEYEDAFGRSSIRNYLYEIPYIIYNNKSLVVSNYDLVLDGETIFTIPSAHSYDSAKLKIVGFGKYGEVIVHAYESLVDSDMPIGYYMVNLNTKKVESMKTNEKGYLENSENYEMPIYFMDIK